MTLIAALAALGAVTAIALSPASAQARYGLRTDTRHANAGRSPEPVHNVPSGNCAAVIAMHPVR